MDRRSALVGMTGIATATVLLAGPRNVLAQTAAPTGPAAAAASGKVLGEGAYKTRTLRLGTFSKQTSTLALTQAVNPKIKEFAQFEIDEQTAVAQVLTDTTNPPPAPLDQMMRSKMAELQADRGKAFDAAYLGGQIRTHHALYMVQQDFLNGVPVNHDREHIAVLARMVIQMHLTMLHDLQTMVGAV